MNEEKRLKYVKAVCFGIGIMIGLSVIRFAFGWTGGLAGGLGGLFGAMLGLIFFEVYLRIRG